MLSQSHLLAGWGRGGGFFNSIVCLLEVELIMEVLHFQTSRLSQREVYLPD